AGLLAAVDLGEGGLVEKRHDAAVEDGIAPVAGGAGEGVGALRERGTVGRAAEEVEEERVHPHSVQAHRRPEGVGAREPLGALPALPPRPGRGSRGAPLAARPAPLKPAYVVRSLAMIRSSVVLLWTPG